MGGGRRRTLGPLLLALLLAGGAAAQVVQSSPFLFLNQERILTGSQPGKELLADEAAARDKLRADARAIDSAFEAEEQRLTALRPTLPPEKFRAMADDFDARVVKARQDQDERSSALAQEFDQRRRQFYAGVAPVLVKLMDRYQARAIFDENSVLLADQSVNITEAVIAEIDARPPQQPAPDTGTPPATATPSTPPVEGQH